MTDLPTPCRRPGKGTPEAKKLKLGLKVKQKVALRRLHNANLELQRYQSLPRNASNQPILGICHARIQRASEMCKACGVNMSRL